MVTSEDLLQQQKKVTLLRAEGKYKETIEESYKLLKLGAELNDPKSMLIGHMGSAASYYCIGDINEAFNSIEAYHDICNKFGDETDYMQLYNVLFLLFEFIKDYQRAKETLNKTIKLGKLQKRYNIVSNAYSNLSHIYIQEEKYQEALHMAEKGLEMAKLHEPASEILEFRVSLNIALSYIKLKKLDIAKTWVEKLISNPILESFIREKTQCYNLQGVFFLEIKQYEKSFHSFTIAKQLAESYDDLYLLKEIQEQRCNLCELMNNVTLGYAVQKEYIQLLKDISKREFSNMALKLDVKHNLSILKKKANNDYLTDLYNRKYVETLANEWLEQSLLSNENITCIVFDIDDFKGINDHYGHLFGDEIIKKAAKASASIVGTNEVIGRYGGDEFVVILKGTAAKEGVEKAMQLKESFENLQVQNGGNSISLQISIGISDNSDRQLKDFNELFNLADSALYRSKQNGKNMVTLAE